MHFHEIWESLQRFASRRRPARKRATPRLELEVLEERSLLSSGGVVTGSFIGGKVVDAAVHLKSTAGPTIPVALTSLSNANGSFTFSGMPAGTYEISAAPFAGLDMLGTISIGSASTNAAGTIAASFTLAAGQTVVENVVLKGGLAPAAVNLDPFLTTYEGPTPGTGNPGNTPIITAKIPNQNLPTATIAAAATGAIESGGTVTITTTAANNFAVGQSVTVAGVGLAGYDGTFTITAVTSTTFSYTDATTGLAASGGGTATISGTGLDLAGFFNDADFTNTQLTLNITNGTTPETLDLTLFDGQAPATVANFLDYVNSGEYNNDVFSRLITDGETLSSGTSGIGVLQGGGISLENPSATNPGLQLTAASPPNIPNEFSSANLNNADTIAMAETGAPNSASDQFFFNTVNNSSLNTAGSSNSQPFTVFGELSNASSDTALTALAATGTQNESAATNAASIVAAGVDLQDIPLTGYTAAATNLFPSDATASNFMVINSISVSKPDEESLTYSVTSNSDPALVTAAFLPNHPEQLTLTRGTGTGTATIVVTATDRFGASTSQSFTVNVGLVLGAPLEEATATVPINTTMPISGGVGPFKIASTTLPADNDLSATISGANVVVAGTPTAADVGSYTITVKDANGAQASNTFVVSAAATLGAPSVEATAGQSYSATMAISNGTSPFSIVSTTLPADNDLSASISGSNVDITGSPTAADVGTYSITIEDANGAQATNSVVVNAAPTLGAPSLDATAGASYSATMPISGGTGPFIIAVNGLPSDLTPTISGSNVDITGSPTAADVGNYTVTVEDANGRPDEQQCCRQRGPDAGAAPSVGS